MNLMKFELSKAMMNHYNCYFTMILQFEKTHK